MSERVTSSGPGRRGPGLVGAPAFGVDDRLLTTRSFVSRSSYYGSSWLDPVSGDVVEEAPSMGSVASVRGGRILGTMAQWAGGLTSGSTSGSPIHRPALGRHITSISVGSPLTPRSV